MISNKNSREENRNYLKSILPMTKSFINWKESIGCKINYEYYWNNDIYKGTLTIGGCIVKNKNSHIYINEFHRYIQATHLYECKLGAMLNTHVKGFKYEIKEIINNVLIVDREYKTRSGKKYKYYKYKCLNCGKEDWTIEYNLCCNTCCNPPQKIVLGINTIWDKARWMCDLGVSEEDAKKYTPQSNKSIIATCPHCGRGKKYKVRYIYNNHSINCVCGDGFSYPEKFMYSVLKQLNIDFETQYHPKWIKNKRYDFYIPKLNTIIEVHGRQHYEEFNRGRSLLEEQENDRYKMESALNNGINNYIVVDCRKSELEWIKNNILDSKLSKIFDLSNIDWNKCEEFSLNNLVKEVCDYWFNYREIGNVDITTSYLAKYFKLSVTTVRNYLKYGTEIGWCNYDSKEENKRSGVKNKGRKATQETKDKIRIANGKKVFCRELNEVFLSTTEAERQLRERGIKISQTNISKVANGERKYTGKLSDGTKLTWEYIE